MLYKLFVKKKILFLEKSFQKVNIMKDIKEFTVKSLNNGAHFSYHSDFLKALEADETVKTKVATQLETYKQALKREDEAMLISQKSFKTDEIAQADQERDALYMGLKKMVEAYAYLPNAEIKEAQKVIAQLIKDYGIKPKMQLDKQTGLLVNFIDDLENKYAAQVATLSLGLFVTPLKTANETVKTALFDRTEERSTKEAGAMKAAREEVDEAYRILVKHINANALLSDNTDYEAFIGWSNEHISRYKQQVLK